MTEAPGPGRVLFVGRYRVPPAHEDTWLAASRELALFVRDHLPDVLLFDAFLSPDGSEGTSIHLHRDAAGFRSYLAAAAGRVSAGSRIVEVIRIDLYGSPDDEVVERMRAMGGWPVDVHRQVVGMERPAPGSVA